MDGLTSRNFDPLKKDVEKFLKEPHKCDDEKKYNDTLEKVTIFIKELSAGVTYYKRKLDKLTKEAPSKVQKINENTKKKVTLEKNISKLEDFKNQLSKPQPLNQNPTAPQAATAPTQTTEKVKKLKKALKGAASALGDGLSKAEQTRAVSTKKTDELQKSANELNTIATSAPTGTQAATTNETFLNTSGSFKLYKAGEKNFGPHFLGVLEAIGRVILLPFVAIAILFTSISNKNNPDATQISYKDRLDTAMKGYLGTIKNSILPPSPASARDTTPSDVALRAGYAAQTVADDAHKAVVTAAYTDLADARDRVTATATALADAVYNATLAHNQEMPLAAAAAAAALEAADAAHNAARSALEAATAAAKEATIVKKKKKT